MSFLPPFEGTDTVIIHRSVIGGEDEYGNSETTVIDIPVSGVLTGWGSTGTDFTPERVTITTALTFYFPVGTRIEDEDSFSWRGSKWIKNGIALDYTHPSTFMPSWSMGTAVTVSQVEG